ncbi:DUF2232 domain-containing protein [Microvirga terricola]|uniref:DUF2232 domain-containing protein n=1 Tax=Microvirga terricola TaxID=2719797 RepID=A0ABX0VDT4_9HYPH|nr:DUF2232 domain-containing protein [Microvirga terricola]NIX77658.1 DUF2232 domain-containing protein [Microvirga terricola]
MNFIVTGIGAGLVSALLTVVVLKATLLAGLLYLLAPIPVLIVSLGWNHRSGLVATVVGGLAIALFLSPMSGLGFALITGLPAWWLAYLALLGRADSNGAIEWYPLGRLLAWVAATAALTIAAASVISAHGNFETFHQSARQTAEVFVNLQFPANSPRSLAPELRDELIDLIAGLTPFLSTQGFTVVLALYLWAAAKIVSASKRLPRPWPNVCEIMMPRTAALGVVVGIALAAFNGFIGVFGMALSGGLFMAFALQGLAAIHDRTRGKPGRFALLMGLYVLILITQGVLVVALALFGLADTVFGLRYRFGSTKTDPKQPPTLST